MPSTPQQALGHHGEDLAARHLSRLGYTIHDRNWRCPQGELDLIAHDGTEWVFVEVRTRRAPTTDTAIESITPVKQARVLAAAEAYLTAHNLAEQPWRLDVVVIALGRQGQTIEVIRDAADW